MLARLVEARPQAIDTGLEPSEGPSGSVLEAKGRAMECYAV